MIGGFRTPVRIVVTSILSAAFILLAAGTPHAARADTVAGQPAEPPDPVTVVENFLLARDTGDPFGAASWCAALLELQDVDGQWFVDTPTTVQWVRQLADEYHIDRLTPLLVEGSMVSWTERLTRRRQRFPEALPSSLTIDVHAVIRDGKIAYLSGPYPPIPLRRPPTVAGEPADTVSDSSTTVAPGTLFLGSALGMSLMTLVVVSVGQVLRVSAQRRRHECARRVPTRPDS
jgi:hypothetical protein